MNCEELRPEYTAYALGIAEIRSAERFANIFRAIARSAYPE